MQMLELLDFEEAGKDWRASKICFWDDDNLTKKHTNMTLGISVRYGEMVDRDFKEDEDTYAGIFLTLEQAIEIRHWLDCFIELAKLEKK